MIIYQALTGGSVAVGATLDIPLYPFGPPVTERAMLQWQLGLTGSTQFLATIQSRVDPSMGWIDIPGTVGIANGGMIETWPYMRLRLVNQDTTNALASVTVWVVINHE